MATDRGNGAPVPAGDDRPDGSDGTSSVEERLGRVLAAVDTFQPAPDLWDRVQASLAEDATRRRRRRRLAWGVVGVAIVLAAAALRGGFPGGGLDWRVLEVVETLLLVAIVVGVRPLLDDAGSDFLRAVFRGSETVATNLARLLDVAWNLVFIGMVVVTVTWERGTPVGTSVAAQLDQVLERIGGLLLAMGLLHGLTFLALPVVGVAWLAATTGRRMPRWVAVVLGLAGLGAGLFLVDLLIGLVLGASGG